MAPAVAELAILRRTREPLVESAAGKNRAPLDGHVVRREEARVGRVGVVVGVDRVDDRLARRSEGVAGQRVDRPAADHRARSGSQAVDERDDRSFVERTVVVGEHDVAPARPGDAEVTSGPRPAVGLANQDGSDRLAERLDDRVEWHGAAVVDDHDLDRPGCACGGDRRETPLELGRSVVSRDDDADDRGVGVVRHRWFSGSTVSASMARRSPAVTLSTRRYS